MKYGVRAIAGGGRSSARETIGRVAAGAIAKRQGLTLVHFLAQRKHLVWDRGCIQGVFRGCLGGVRGY